MSGRLNSPSNGADDGRWGSGDDPAAAAAGAAAGPGLDPETAVRMRTEWRAEQRQVEAEALQEAWSRRSVADVVHESMRRGDTLTFHLDLGAGHPATSTVTGTVVDAGADYATVAVTVGDSDSVHDGVGVGVAAAVASRLVDVHLPVAGPRVGAAGAHDRAPWQPPAAPAVMVELRAKARAGGVNPSGRAPTFRARLNEYAFDQRLDARRSVEIGCTLRAGPLRGRLESCAADHVYVAEGGGAGNGGRDLFVPISAVGYVTWTPAEHLA